MKNKVEEKILAKHDCDIIGLRYDWRECRRGKKFPPSKDLSEGGHGKLPGTSCIFVGTWNNSGQYIDTPREEIDIDRDAWKLLVQSTQYRYPYKHCYLVVGEDAGWGDDRDEILLKNCTVVRRIR